MIGDVALVPAVIAQSGCPPLSCFAFFATSANACSVMHLLYCVVCFVFCILCNWINVAFRECSVVQCWL